MGKSSDRWYERIVELKNEGHSRSSAISYLTEHEEDLYLAYMHEQNEGRPRAQAQIAMRQFKSNFNIDGITAFNNLVDKEFSKLSKYEKNPVKARKRAISNVVAANPEIHKIYLIQMNEKRGRNVADKIIGR